MDFTKINIAIDGVSGSGKGVSAKGLAEKLGMKYFDTGATYRTVAYFLDKKGISYDDLKPSDLQELELSFDERGNVCNKWENMEPHIRNERITRLASQLAEHPEVRRYLSGFQKSVVEGGGYIAEWRDIGTRIMPDARVKFYTTATPEIRALRRQRQHEKAGRETCYADILQQIKERDERDMNREVDPLIRLPEAIVIDSTNLTIDEQVEKMYQEVIGKLEMRNEILNKFRREIRNWKE